MRLAFRRTAGSAFFLVELDSLPGEHEDLVLFDCASPDGIHGTVWLSLAEPVANLMMVRARLQVIQYQPAPGFTGFTEYRPLFWCLRSQAHPLAALLSGCPQRRR